LFALRVEPYITRATRVQFIKVEVPDFVLHHRDDLVPGVLVVCIVILCFYLKATGLIAVPAVPEIHIDRTVFENSKKLVVVFTLIQRFEPSHMGNFPLLPCLRFLLRVIPSDSTLAHNPGIKNKDLAFTAAHDEFHLRPVLPNLRSFRWVCLPIFG
jgi:hypothetical protein